MSKKMPRCGAAVLVLAALFRPSPAAAADCDRACLRGLLTQSLDAIVAHQPGACPRTANFRYVEDTIETRPGDGLWKEAVKLRPYRIDVLDARLGVAATLTILDVHGGPAMVAAFAKVVDRQITQLETMVTHNRAEGVLFDLDSLERKTSPIGAMVPLAERTSREAAIRIAELYPAGLRAGSFVTADVPFAPDAYRFEGGRLMAGPGCTFIPGCDQIKSQRIPTLGGLTYRLHRGRRGKRDRAARPGVRAGIDCPEQQLASRARSVQGVRRADSRGRSVHEVHADRRPEGRGAGRTGGAEASRLRRTENDRGAIPI